MKKHKGETMSESQTLVHPDAEGFVEKVTPKLPEDLFLWKCPKDGHQHFRHAGYMKIMVPWMKPNSDKRMGVEDVAVAICVKCKSSFVWVDGQMYDVTDKVDLNAWEQTEKEAHKATGPGGQC
jgi:hypothetical protein